jgi:hypothetical protein
VRLASQNILLPQYKETTVQPQFGNMLGITFLAGLLLLQGSNEALASGDIGVAQQPMSFFGDLGDISTGFASVRTTCLFVYLHF